MEASGETSISLQIREIRFLRQISGSRYTNGDGSPLQLYGDVCQRGCYRSKYMVLPNIGEPDITYPSKPSYKIDTLNLISFGMGLVGKQQIDDVESTYFNRSHAPSDQYRSAEVPAATTVLYQVSRLPTLFRKKDRTLTIVADSVQSQQLGLHDENQGIINSNGLSKK